MVAADKREALAEDLAEYLSRHFRPTETGLWALKSAQAMEVDASVPSMRATYVVHRGDDEPYSTTSQAEATAVAELLNVLETELRSEGSELVSPHSSPHRSQ